MPIVAGLFGLGGPEIIALLVLCLIVGVPVLVVVLIVKAVTGKKQVLRYCPKCGRGLTEPGVVFCSFCGANLQ
jgi:hypothetical protein